MRIMVTSDAACSGQTRAYAEYRVFSSLARFGREVGDATVWLEPVGSTSCACRVAVSLGSGDRVRVRARGRHLHDAIDRAAERAGARVARRVRAAATS